MCDALPATPLPQGKLREIPFIGYVVTDEHHKQKN